MKLLQLCFALALAFTFSSCVVYDHGGYSSQGYSRGSGYSPFTDRGYDDRLRYSQIRRNAFYDDHHSHHRHYDRRDDHKPSTTKKSSSSSSSNKSSSSSNRSSGSSSSSKKSSSSSSRKSSSSSGGGSKKSSGSSRGVKDSPRNTPARLR